MNRNKVKAALKRCLTGCSEAGCEYNGLAVCNGIECKTCAEALLEDVLELIDENTIVRCGKCRFRIDEKCYHDGPMYLEQVPITWYCADAKEDDDP